MEMDRPIGTNALDVGAQGVVGKPLDRVDGRLKVTGQARYAYEVQQAPAVAYGCVVEASIGKGRIRSSIRTRRRGRPAWFWCSAIETRPSRARAITMRLIRCSPARKCRITASRSPLSWLRPSSRRGRPPILSA